MENPYKLSRQELGLTQKELAATSNVTVQVVTNLEKGLFYKPPKAIVRAIHEAYQTKKAYWWDAERSHRMYTQWIREQRAINQPSFPPFHTLQPHTLSGTHQTTWDWVDFRHQVHRTFRGFCRMLVFQPSMLAEWEDRGLNRNTVRIALMDVGYSEIAADIIVSHRKSSIQL
jgi:DNA-binding transcriptional regulator YiaG